MLTGKAYGAIDPAAPANKGLARLDDAPRNGHGLVDYSMDFAMLRPADPAKGNGKIVYEFINRGSPLSFSMLNNGSLTDPGNGFLMRQGYEIVWAGWQPDANPHTAVYQAHFPVAKHRDGSPIVGRTMESLVPDTPQSSNRQTVEGDKLTADVAYAPTSLDAGAAHASLTVRENYDDRPVALPRSVVAFLPGRRVTIDMSAASARGFDQGAIYELTYDGKDPWVGGVGFASTRDLISYLRGQPLGSTGPGTGNGPPVEAVQAWGYSQDGRLLRDFVWQGFNADLAGHKVFDGVQALVGGAKMTDHNLQADETPFAQSSRWIRQHEEHNYPGGEFPFTYKTLHDPLTGKTDGILAKCRATDTCPKIFQVDSDFEIWNGGAWLLTTGPTGRPIQLPSNVRAFMISGQSHGPGNGTPRDLPACKLDSNPLDGAPTYRALMVDMDQWVSNGTRPPNSEYPTLRNGTLQTLSRAAKTWPRIPGYPFNKRIVEPRVGDFSVQPPTFGATYPVYVPTTDQSGNPEGGVITPDVAAPLGTYMGRNFRKAGHAEDELCGVPYGGGFIPFAKKPEDKRGDSRPSVDELYPHGEEQYRAQRQRAIEALIKQRLVLPDELTTYRDEVPFPKQ
ncbi:alpha/beta hydrolase domain-containing protein [Streptomyces sp. NBC_00144]|uniref:alpha/beta hydrolase domain-containing protein n=1 Tax=Streptomyces sp. NBC_00144 TaxID=2975665 RepID=UPI0032502A15